MEDYEAKDNKANDNNLEKNQELTEEKYKQLYQFYLEKKLKEQEDEEVIIILNVDNKKEK